MGYYNPITKEEKDFGEVCALYNTSFPTSSEILHGVWHLVHEQELPAPEKGFRFEMGEVRLVDGKYIRTWSKIPLTEDELASVAHAEALNAITESMARAHVQTAAFGTTDFELFAKTGLFEEWAPGVQYSKGYRLVCDGIVYEVVHDVLSVENQPPFARGMPAVYRPLSVDPESGEEPDGSRERPFAFLHGMDVKNGSHYSHGGKLWLARADMPACVWEPGTPGLWQWEEVVPDRATGMRRDRRPRPHPPCPAGPLLLPVPAHRQPFEVPCA